VNGGMQPTVATEALRCRLLAPRRAGGDAAELLASHVIVPMRSCEMVKAPVFVSPTLQRRDK
jgi:hypothetical protein